MSQNTASDSEVLIIVLSSAILVTVCNSRFSYVNGSDMTVIVIIFTGVRTVAKFLISRSSIPISFRSGWYLISLYTFSNSIM